MNIKKYLKSIFKSDKDISNDMLWVLMLMYIPLILLAFWRLNPKVILFIPLIMVFSTAIIYVFMVILYVLNRPMKKPYLNIYALSLVFFNIIIIIHWATFFN